VIFEAVIGFSFLAGLLIKHAVDYPYYLLWCPVKNVLLRTMGIEQRHAYSTWGWIRVTYFRLHVAASCIPRSLPHGVQS
jgi:hypothetical protein